MKNLINKINTEYIAPAILFSIIIGGLAYSCMHPELDGAVKYGVHTVNGKTITCPHIAN